MKTEILQIHEPLHQCPKCSKNSLVQQGSDKFYCLWCGFKRDVSELETTDYPSLFAILLLFGLIVMLL